MTSVASPLPANVEHRLLEFLSAGKTGSLTVEIRNGRVLGWKITESGRIPD